MGPVRQAPDPLGSASHASISGTCSTVWRMRDLPVAPISSTRASSNKLGVREERSGGVEVCGESTCSYHRDIIRDFTVKRRKSSDLPRFKLFEIYVNLTDNGNINGWPLYLSSNNVCFLSDESRTNGPLFALRNFFFKKVTKNVNMLSEERFLS